MIIIIIGIIIIVGLIILYLTSIDFEMGTGFTEEKNKAREGEYMVIEKKKLPKETKLLE